MPNITREKQKRIENCNFVKAVLMLSVVLCHSVSFWGGGWFTAYTPSEILPSMRLLSNWTGSFHVYGFVLVSGYLFYYLRNDLGKYKQYLAFLMNKIRRLVVPYVFVCLIWVIPITTFYYKYSIKEIFMNYVLGTNAGQLWFLLALFWCFAICWILLEYIRKDCAYIFVALIFYFVGHYGHNRLPDFFSIFRGLQFVILFVTGHIMRKYDRKTNHTLVLISSLVFHAILFIGKQTIQIPVFAQGVYDLILHLSGAIGAFELIQFISDNVNTNNKLLNTFSKNSMPIYLFHQQWIYIVISILAGKVRPMIIVIMCLFVSILGSVVQATILRISKSTSLVIGER